MRVPSPALLLVPVLSLGLIRVEAEDRSPLPAVAHAEWAEVRAVLERRCLECHGGARVRSGFRLATAETFRQGGARGPVLNPERLETSRFLEVVAYRDPDLAMPPDGQLPDAEFELLREWVLAGAPWPDGSAGQLADPDRFPPDDDPDLSERLDWWAYRRLENPSPPPVAGPFGAHPIDSFLEVGRIEAGTEASPRADSLTLLRRASFDLCGLPPTPAQQHSFLEMIERLGFDRAWSRVIDRLLDSVHYGEHQARRWLDLVRYADSNGYERDNPKENIWRYRDYVVRSYQQDKPFDRFGIEQLAGDEFSDFAPELLARPDDPDPLLATGYYRLTVWDDEPADRPQSRADELADIVDTTGQAFLGTTVGCARCHDHKADPFSQQDYYSLTAMFNHVVSFAGPAYSGEGGGSRTRDVADLPAAGQITSTERDRWIARLEGELDALAAKVRIDVESPTETLVPDARAGGHVWAFQHGGEVAEGWFQPGFDDLAWDRGESGFGRQGTPGSEVRTEWTDDRIRLRTTFRLTELPDLLHVSLHHDEDVRIWINGVEVFSRRGFLTRYETVVMPAQALQALVVGRNVLAVECRQTGGGQYVDVGLFAGLPPREGPQRAKALRELVVENAEQLLDPADAAEVRRLQSEREQARTHPVSQAYPALVASEPSSRRPQQRVLLRGSAHAPGDVVDVVVPAAFRVPDPSVDYVMPEVPPSARSSGRRLAFARWLFDGGRHLSARVLANRIWQSHFGRGLCPSPGDLGRLGERPTHPLLLDHLASKVLEFDWSVKRLHRYVMTSAAYRMAGDADDRSRSADPTNRSYWHFPPRRLTAEQYRDAVLAVSGRLDPRVGGPAVFPKMQEAARQTASRPDHAWPTSIGEDRNRRSLYVYTKRTLGFPLLQALDRPDPDIACPERFPTNVPTQSLMLLNGEFTGEQASAFADRILAETEDGPDRVRRAVRLALGREADVREVERHLAFLRSLQEEHGRDERAAWQLLALLLFNTNEFLWID